MARALTLAAGIVLLAAAGLAFLASLIVLLPGGETDADTWLGIALLLGAVLLVGGIADLLIIKGIRPPAACLADTAPERSAPPQRTAARTAPIVVGPVPLATRAAIDEPVRGGVDYGSTLGPGLHELGFQLFGVVGGILADLLTAFLQRRRRARDEPASPVTAVRRGWMARVRAGLRMTAALILLTLWGGAIGGLVGVVEAFVNAPATAWNTLTTEPAFQVTLCVCVGVTVVGGLILSRLRRG
jgi:hypothetical protein